MLQQSKCEVSKARGKAVRVEKKGACLSHVPKYHWLPGLERKKRERGKGDAEVSSQSSGNLLCDREQSQFTFLSQIHLGLDYFVSYLLE